MGEGAMTEANPTRERHKSVAHLFFRHAGHVPLALVILEALLAAPGYFTGVDAYLLLTAGLVQAWLSVVLERKGSHYAFLTNFTGPLVYSAGEFAMEGMAFLAQWHHQAYWGYALGFAVLQGFPLWWAWCRSAATVGESILRASIPLVTYALFEAQSKGQGLSPVLFWADTAHQYLTIVLLLLGALMGFVEVNLHRARREVQTLTDKLRLYSSWALGSSVLEKALQNSETLALKRGHRAVLFVDIRGFTAWSEQRSPEEVVHMLNIFYGKAETALARYPIKIKFTADEILAVFETCADALTAAKALMPALQDTLRPLGLSAGAGLHYGPVVEGVLGGSNAKAYDFIGDTVNTAQRLCDAARAWELLVSQAVSDECGLGALVERRIEVKGKSAPLVVRAMDESAFG
jgi:adenylate cyclase